MVLGKEKEINYNAKETGNACGWLSKSHNAYDASVIEVIQSAFVIKNDNTKTSIVFQPPM